MDRDELVERVAEALDKLLNNTPRMVPIYALDECARAALAIIEPAVREECAKVAEGSPWRPEKYGDRYRYWPWYGLEDNRSSTGEVAAHSERIAAAIRAGAKP